MIQTIENIRSIYLHPLKKRIEFPVNTFYADNLSRIAKFRIREYPTRVLISQK